MTCLDLGLGVRWCLGGLHRESQLPVEGFPNFPQRQEDEQLLSGKLT